MVWQLISNTDIHKSDWDNIIEKNNLPIELFSWYMDIVCPEWKIAKHISKDVWIPLGFHKKYGLIPQFFRPPFWQKTQVIPDPNLLSELDIQDLVKRIQKKGFRNTICIQYFPEQLFNTIKTKRTNYILNLDTDWNLSNNHKKSLQKFKTNPTLQLDEHLDRETYLDFFAQHKKKEIDEAFIPIPKFSELVQKCISRSKGFIWGVRDQESELVAACFFTIHHNRIVYLNAVSSLAGLKTEGMYFMIGQLYERFFGQNMILDWEGSDIPGVAYFMAGFGSKKEEYTVLQF